MLKSFSFLEYIRVIFTSIVINLLIFFILFYGIGASGGLSSIIALFGTIFAEYKLIPRMVDLDSFYIQRK